MGAARSAPAATKTACVTPQPPPSPSQPPTIGTLEASPAPDGPAPEGSGDSSSTVVIIGAGPAGLTAGLQLAKHGVTDSLVLEADDVVGGISRTVERDGWRFDLGGHRFFTKVPEVEALWHELLPDGRLMRRPRMSRIYYDGKFYDYPLRASNALAQPRRGRGREVRRLLRLGAGPPAEGHRQLRGLGVGPLRLAPLPHLLQDLHREGLGRAGVEHAGRLGRPADQEPVAVEGRRQLAAAQARQDRRHLADRGVPLPDVRAGDDVGDVPGTASSRPAARSGCGTG